MRYRPVAIGLFVLTAFSARAQWIEPDSGSLATTDKVAIGTSAAPAKQLEVIGEASFSSFLTAGEVVVANGAGRGRLHMANPNWVAMTLNTRVTSAWQLDDTSSPGWAAKFDTRSGYDQFAIMRVPPGLNPHTDEKVLLQVHANGHVGIGLPIGGTAAERLHILNNADANNYVQLENPFAGANAVSGVRMLSNTATTILRSHSSARTLQRYGVTVGGWSELQTVAGNGLLVGTAGDTPLILGTNNLNRLHITGAGNIGINTPAPAEGLHLLNRNLMLQASDATGTQGVTYISLGSRGATGGVYQYRLVTASSGGAFGVAANGIDLFEYSDNAPENCCKHRLRIYPATGVTLPKTLIMDGTGNIGIGVAPTVALDVSGAGRIRGDLVVDGNIGAKYQDVAEWVPSTADLAPGTVVVLNPDAINEVMPSARAYDTRVAGVVSAQPGIILGEAGANKEQIATTGRVRVRVDATKAPVAVGDLLVTSDLPGFAMKSQPIDLGGVAIHRPGTIVGKALEPLAGGTGEVLVLLSMQ